MTEPVESGELYQHKWLYTFLPKSRSEEPYDDALYLLAYCPTCDTSVSSKIKSHDTFGPFLTKMGIPRFGCVSPFAGL